MTPAVWMVVAGVCWVALALASRWLLAARPRGEDVAASAVFRLIQVYARLVHRLEIEGLEHVPVRGGDGGQPRAGDEPLIVVCNHTAGVDPLLVQAALPFEVRWLMAEDMRLESVQWMWDFARVIFVDRQSSEGKGLRAALRHLHDGGVLGVFPEGNIERPSRRLLPFREGVGMLIQRTGASVLPVVIDGTPQVDPAWASLWRPSRARVRVLAVRRYERSRGGEGAARVTEELRAGFAQATGWPLNDQPPRFEGGQWWYASDDGGWTPASRVEVRR